MDSDTFDPANPFFKEDINKLCGVCTKKLDLAKTYSIKKQISYNEDVLAYQVLESISEFKFQENGTQFICRTCFNNTCAAYKFQNMCNKAQMYMDNFIEHQSKFTEELQPAEQTEVEEIHIQIIEDDYVETKIKQPVKKMQCKVCHKFIRAENMRVHIRIHTGERPYKCEHCGTAFYHSSALKVHKLIHTDKPGFICKMCGKAFKTPNDLKRHEQRHSEEWLFKCELCDLSFKIKQHLRRHLMVHTADKHFTCEICAKSFKSRSALVLHQKNHTGDRRHACVICERTFVQKAALTYHLRTHNNAQTSADIKADSQLDLESHEISEIPDT